MSLGATPGGAERVGQTARPGAVADLKSRSLDVAVPILVPADVQADAIDAWMPLLLFAVLFGLSMDYHVFLLSRIRERCDETGDNTEAVAYGLRSTAGIITGAALIMVVVFGAFATGRTIINQFMGFGLAVAVLLDATLVRSILVPASMEVLGKRYWYLPAWLDWLPDLLAEAEEHPVGGPEEAHGW